MIVKRSLLKFASNLKKDTDGVWYTNKAAPVSYPYSGNDACFKIEDQSFWFKHRNDCIIELIKKFPPPLNGPIFDVGGGNGYVAKGLMEAGFEIVLVEPGKSGAQNAKKRGLENVICGTTLSAKFKKGSLSAIGIFDVIEHISDDIEFLSHLYDLLEPGGKLYLSVPAYKFLWSDADDFAGHFRRYSFKHIQKMLNDVDLKIQFITGIFMWLVIPIWIFRVLPSYFGLKNTNKINKAKADHTLPAILRHFVKRMNKWECIKIKRESPIPFGASLLVAATKS